MKTGTLRRGMAMLLSLVMCLSVFAGLSTPAFAATDVTDEVYMLSFPREGDANYDHTGSWGHDELHFMNGWRSAATYYTNIRAMGSFEGNICYCIEPGVSQNIGDVLTGKGEDFWIQTPADRPHHSVLCPAREKLRQGRRRDHRG